MRQATLNPAAGLVVVCAFTTSTPADILNVPGDFATIQAAINAASSGDEVVIAPGSYAGCNNFNGKAITVRSTDPNNPKVVAATVLTGCASPLTGAMKFDSGEGPDSILRGLTISATGETTGVMLSGLGGASPTIDRCVFTGHNGATNRAMQIEGSPTITQCTFIDNHPGGDQLGCGSVGGGAAILICTGSAVKGATISDCTFTNNRVDVLASTGGAIMSVGPVTITGCTFDGNSVPSNGMGSGAVRLGGPGIVLNCTFNNNSGSQGGAITGAIGSTIEDCQFTGNTAAAGGAARVFGAIENCTFTMNNAAEGGAILALGSATVSICTFTENTATSGGAVSLEGDAIISNCSIEQNTATGNGGGVWAGSGSCTVSDCFIKLNSAGGAGGGMYVGASAMPTLADTVFCQNTPNHLTTGGLTTFSGVVLATDEPECAPMIAEFGACCLPSGSCVTTTLASCVAAAGVFQGAATTCAGANCPPKSCPSDITNSGTVDVDDLLQLINDWGNCS